MKVQTRIFIPNESPAHIFLTRTYMNVQMQLNVTKFHLAQD